MAAVVGAASETVALEPEAAELGVQAGFAGTAFASAAGTIAGQVVAKAMNTTRVA